MGAKDDSRRGSGENNRPVEQEAVRTTIVGGRPPGSGKSVGTIPRGIEVLVKKAAVDESFRERLMEARAEAAADIGLELNPAETAMLQWVPHEQLERIIEQTEVPRESRAAFLGRAAAVMLAALGAVGTACRPPGDTTGIAPDIPEKTPVPRTTPQGTPEPVRTWDNGDKIEAPQPRQHPTPTPDTIPTPTPTPTPTPEKTPIPTPLGVRPDRPTPRGIRPDRP